MACAAHEDRPPEQRRGTVVWWHFTSALAEHAAREAADLAASESNLDSVASPHVDVVTTARARAAACLAVLQVGRQAARRQGEA